MSELLIKNLNWDGKHTLYLTITPDIEVSAESGFLDEKIEGVQAIALPEHGDLVEISKVKEAQRIHGQAGHWESYVPVILEAST